LAIAPKCRGELSSSFIRNRHKTVTINDIFLDPKAPIVDVMIDGSLIYSVQIDSRFSMNVMTFETMKELRLSNMTSIFILFRMADQSRINS